MSSVQTQKSVSTLLSFFILCFVLFTAPLASALTAQTITSFAPATPVLFSTGGTFALTATGGGSGNPVVFASTTASICTVAGSTVTKVAVGTCNLTANQAGNATFSAAVQVSKSVVISKGTQTITFTALSGKAFGAAPFTVAATASSGLTVAFTSTTTGICTVSASTVTIVTVGTCTIASNQAGSANFIAATQVSQSFAIAKGAQTITFAALAGKNFGGAPFTVAATASSALAVAFTSTTTPVCTVSGATVTLVSVGTCTIAANQAGNANYNVATQVAQSFTVAKGAQTITFAALSGKGFGVAPFAVSATASSGLAVVFTSTTTPVCTVSGSTVTLVALGTCTIAANQVGNTNYNAATQVAQSFTVAKGAQTITFAALVSKALGAAPFAVSATSSSALAVVFTSTTTPVCTVSASTVTIVAVGTCAIAANQPGNTNYNAATQVAQSFAVMSSTQTITFAALVGKTFGSAPFAVSATASSGLAVTFTSTTAAVCTVSGANVTLVAVGTCTIAANQAGNGSFSAAPQVTQSFAVAKSAQTITFAALPGKTMGNAPFPVSATASSGLAVAFTSTTTPVCTVSGSTVTLVSAGTCTITANQAGNGNFSAATAVPQSFTVASAALIAQTITGFAPASPIAYAAGGNFAVSASGGASNKPVIFASTAPSVCTVSGSTVSIVTAGSCVLTANQAGDSTYSAAPQVTASVAITPATQTIAFATLASKLLATMPFSVSAAASSGLAVTFTSSTNAVCTVAGATITLVSVGTCTINANQSGNGNYSAAPQVSQSFNVVTGISTIYNVPLAAGDSHNCALTNTNGVKCWGWGELGQLGDGSAVDQYTPVDVAGLGTGITAVTAGNTHSCAITLTGGVKCWGNNYYGQLGDNTTIQRNTPVDVVGLQSGVVAISAGQDHTCAITKIGGIKCWGYNGVGQLGDGSGIDQLTPINVFGLDSGVIDVRAGQSHTCAVMAAGGIKCWGNNYNGQLGNGDSLATVQYIPVDVANLSPGMLGVESGASHSCGLTSTGGVVCWGGNVYGQLGNGDNSTQFSPVAVVGLPSVTSIIAGGYYSSCALNAAGQMQCWGSRVGSNVPINIDPFIGGVTEVGLGLNHTCVMITGGGVRCWGNNVHGQLGDGTNNYAPSLVTAIGFSGTTGISQAISFPALAAQNLGAGSIDLVATATSGLAVTYSSNTNGVCTVSGTAVILLAVGTCTVAADQAGNGNYGAAPQIVRSFTITIGTQTIYNFAPATPITYPPSGYFYIYANGGGSGNPIIFASISPAVCTVTGSYVYVILPGICTLTANQAGNTNYTSAPQVSATVVVQKSPQTISFWTMPSDLTPKPFDTPPYAIVGYTTSNLGISYASNTPAVCTVSGVMLTLSGLGICTIVADQAGDNFYSPASTVMQSFTVFQATQTITQFTPAYHIGYSLSGTFTLGAQGGTSGNSILFASTTPAICTVVDTTATIVSAGSCVVTANQAGNANYQPAAQATFTVTIDKATPVLFLSFGGWSNIVYGSQPTIPVVLNRINSNASLLVNIVSTTPTVCSYSSANSNVNILSAGTCQLNASQAGNVNYNPASAAGSLTITQASQAISGFTPPTPVAFAAGGSFTLNAVGGGSGSAVTFASTTTSICTVSGSTVTMLTTGICALTANQAGSVSYFAAPQVTASVTIEVPTIAVTTPRIVTPALTPANVGLPYAGKIIVSASYVVTSASVSGLPTGMTATHNGVGTIQLGGVPTTLGAFPLIVTASNASGTVMLPITIQVNAPLINISSFASGSGHNCAIKDSGVICWGGNANGQLGNGTTTNSTAPVIAIPAGSNATVVSAKSTNTCAVVAGGVQCWGSIAALTPTSIIPAGSGATDVAVGKTHACAVIAGGAQCWGNNTYAQLGNGSSGYVASSATPVVAIAANSGVTAVSAGVEHSCAVVNGGVRCWGTNDLSVLGVSSPSVSNIPLVTIADGSGVTAISTGGPGSFDASFNCALVNGGVRCWGAGESGIAYGTGQTIIFNDRFAANSGVTALASGGVHSCVIISGSVQCWGRNTSGQLGGGYSDNNNPSFYQAPVNAITSGVGIGAGGNATLIASGGAHSCALVNNIVTCWGDNSAGQLGDATPSQNSSPIANMGTASGVTAVGAGASHSCAIVGGGVQCWGMNSSSQLGNNASLPSATPVSAIAAASNVTAITGGANHSCAVVNGNMSGIIQCWGLNSNGQLGNGNTTSAYVPTSASTASGATAIAAGTRHTCAIINSAVQCWGLNSNGQLGNNTSTQSLTPVAVTNATSGATAIAAGNGFSCAAISGGVQCWGSNVFGKLGNATNTQSLIPIAAIAAGSGVAVTPAAITTGSDHACAIVNGGVQCWGYNTNGQLGNVTTTASNIPVTAIAAGSGAIAVAAGSIHTCAIVNGGVQCWGNNSAGQLGTGVTANTTNFNIPTPAQSLIPISVIPAGSGVTSLSAGDVHTCAVINSATLCWGDNTSGQIGLNDTYPLRKVIAIAQLGALPITAPAAPTLTNAASLVGGALLTFTAPGNNGGSIITGYIATCTASGNPTVTANAAANATTATVIGLIGNITYSCAIAATSAIGTSAASNSLTVTPTPLVAPSAPTLTSAVPGAGSALLTFTAPTNNGGSATTGYVATCTAAGNPTITANAAANATTATVVGLVGGTVYSCSVTATNSVGISAASNSLTVTSTATVAPSAPTLVSAVPGAGSAILTFTAPTNNGGSAITGYIATCTASGNPTVTANAAANATTVTVTGLIGNIAYSCSITATNAIGTGAASNSLTVTPAPVVAPSAPTLVSAVPGAGSAALTFVAPTSNGGSVITGYIAACVAAGNPTITANAAGNATTATVAGLIAGVAYSCSVLATNSAGASVASNAIAVTPTSSTPIIAITAPANNSTVINTVSLTITASIPIGAANTLSRIDIYDGITALGYFQSLSGTGLTVNFVWTPFTVGSRTLTAVVTDSVNQTATSAPLTLIVLAKPSVTLTSLSNFYLAASSIDLIATAAPNVTLGTTGTPPMPYPTPTIASVELIATNTVTNQTASLATITAAPYSYRWANVPAGSYTFTAKATDSNGVTNIANIIANSNGFTSTGGGVVNGGAPAITVTVAPASAISIAAAAGLNGSSTTDDSTYVGGTISAPPNASVTINGQIATTTTDGRFFINHVPLPTIGMNTITLTVATADGYSATQSISITRNALPTPPPNTPVPPNYAITVAQGATQAPGSPLPVAISVSVTNGGIPTPGSYINIECSATSAGIATGQALALVLTSAGGNSYNCTYNQAGLYTVNVTIRNSMAMPLYTVSRQVKVEGPSEKNRTARGVYLDLVDRLKAGNKAGALNLFSGQAQITYNTIFNQLGSNLTTYAGQLGTISSVTTADDISEVVITRDVNGQPRTFSVYMYRTSDGILRIDSM